MNSSAVHQVTEVSFTRPNIIIFIFECLLVIVVGIILNTIIIWLYCYKKIPPTLFNFFLTILGILNIVQNLGAIIFILFYHRENEDLIPLQRTDELCNLIDGQPLFWVGAFSTVYTICFMNIKWYTIITKPLRIENKKKRLVNFIIGFWCMASIIIIPNLFAFEYDTENGFCKNTNHFLGVDLLLAYNILLFA